MDKIQVLLACDENYAQHCGVTMVSVLANKRSSVPIKITVFHDGISEISQRRLQDIADKFSAELLLLDVSTYSFEDLPTHHYLSKAAYFRLGIADMHPDKPEKIIYLDVDVLVRHDITELWEVDVSQYHLAAVIDLGVSRGSLALYREYLGMPKSEPYFNSGVLLVNAKKWREFAVGAHAIQFIRDKGLLRYLDQDALNAILWGRWKKLLPKWNVNKAVFHQYYQWRGSRSLSLETLHAVINPSIVHFTASIKPWHYACGLPFADEYYHYLGMTAWKAYNPRDVSFRSFCRRYSWFLRRKLFD